MEAHSKINQYKSERVRLRFSQMRYEQKQLISLCFHFNSGIQTAQIIRRTSNKRAIRKIAT